MIGDGRMSIMQPQEDPSHDGSGMGGPDDQRQMQGMCGGFTCLLIYFVVKT
jgi:hypothetical protein